MEGASYSHHPPPSYYPYYHRQPYSQQLPPSHALSQLPPPPPGTHNAAPIHLPHHDEVRTLFIAGLPDDCKPREIYNLFREFPGYESSHLRSSSGSTRPYAFAVFADQQCALAAQRALDGLTFDFENESILYIDLAKSNSKFTKRARTGFGSNVHMPGMGNSAYSTNGYPSTQSQTSFDHIAAHDVGSKKPVDSTTYGPQNNPPCPTLFVANLGPTCSDHELTEIFSKYPGFLKLKMQRRNGVSVAFVDFQDTDSSTEALSHLQGAALDSSFGDGIRLEYAKSRMGQRKRER